MPSHPERVRRNYPPRWWEDRPLVQHTHWHPSLWLTALVMLCFLLIGYFSRGAQ